MTSLPWTLTVVSIVVMEGKIQFTSYLSKLYRNGQRLLEKQRFQFPPSWLYIDNIEGEWGAFNDIMRRKDSAIQQQVANLQMKIVQEDRAVESRTTDLLTDWEKTKPVTVSLALRTLKPAA